MPQEPTSGAIPYADLFEKEAGGQIAAIRSVLAGLADSDGDAEIAGLVRRLRNAVHGLAGVASAVGVEPIRQLMGAVEEAAVAVMRAGLAPPAPLLEAVGEAVDAVETIARDVLEGRHRSEPVDIERLITAVRTGADLE